MTDPSTGPIAAVLFILSAPLPGRWFSLHRSLRWPRSTTAHSTTLCQHSVGCRSVFKQQLPKGEKPIGGTCSFHWSMALPRGPDATVFSFKLPTYLTTSTQNSWKCNSCLAHTSTSQLQDTTKATQHILKCVTASTFYSWKNWAKLIREVTKNPEDKYTKGTTVVSPQVCISRRKWEEQFYKKISRLTTFWFSELSHYHEINL